MKGKPVNVLVLSVLLSFLEGSIVFAQRVEGNYEQRTVSDGVSPNQINNKRLIAAVSGLVLTNYALYRYLRGAWWEDGRTHFHFYRGWRRTGGNWDFGFGDSPWRHMDKLGHIYSAKLLAQTASTLSQWVGFQRRRSLIYGAIIGSLLMLQIEINDAYSREWGFSWADFTANEIGAFYPLLQEILKPLQKIDIKFSYQRSHEYHDPEVRYLVKDYAGMTYWFCYDWSQILPQWVNRFWPRFLNPAIGYGITKRKWGKIEWYLALDYNLDKLPFHNRLWNTAKWFLQKIHLPAPTLRFTPKPAFYFFYF